MKDSGQVADSFCVAFFRARVHVEAITSLIGAHPYGSVANRVQMRDYILGELARIQSESSAAGFNRISFRVRGHNGGVPKDFHGADWQQVWESMGNILVHVAASTTGKAALLVSGHYDTVFFSKGASDNTAGISSMLEMIEVLAYDAPSKHELIFAFVNGEEYGLLGAADLTNFDSEFDNVAMFINVDGTPGAKQLNLRTSGGWIDLFYSAVPRPLAFVVAADIFNSGWINSDTDFSVYTEQIPGIDMVTFSHRQTYHSMKDVTLEDGVLQFQGDNMLALVRRIVNYDVDSLSSLSGDTTGHVYFSYLNSGYAVYTLTTNYIVFVMLIIGYLLVYGVIMVHRYIYWKDLGMSTSSNPILCLLSGAGFVFITFAVALGTVALFSLIASALIPMFSYTSPAMAVFAFFPMTLCAMYLTQWFLRSAERYWQNTLEVSRHRLLWGTGFCWWWLLIFASGASKRTGSTYLLFFLAFFHLVAVVLHHVFFFFGTLTEKPNTDMFEVMENAENQEDEEDKKQYDETGQVRRRPVRPVEHQRWKAAFTRPDLAWFLIFAVATVPPMLFYLDVMVPLIQLAATDMAAWVSGPLIAVLVFLLNVNFLPLSRRGHHYGIIACILLVITIFTFFPVFLGGASAFTASAPYQLIPHQVADRLTFEPNHPYTYSLKLVCEILAPDHVWTCKNNPYSCSAPGFAAPPIPTSSPIFPPHGFQYAARINSTNAWIHTITFPTGTEEVILNGIFTTVDPRNSTVTLLLSSYSATSSWTIEFNGPYGLVSVQSYWDDLASVPSMPSLIAKLPDWVTIRGRGSWLMSQIYSVAAQ